MLNILIFNDITLKFVELQRALRWIYQDSGRMSITATLSSFQGVYSEFKISENVEDME